MNVAIKPKVVDQIRIMAERYPDDDAPTLARRGGWMLSQVRSALATQRREQPKSRL